MPVAYVDFPDEEAVRLFVIAENIARRHLSVEERGELAGKLVVNGASTRSAAKAAGVSQKTAQRAAAKERASGESSDSPEPNARTTGADGKSYPATKTKTKAKAKPKTKPKTKPRPTPSRAARGKKSLAVRVGEIGDDLLIAHRRLDQLYGKGELPTTAKLDEKLDYYVNLALDAAVKLATAKSDKRPDRYVDLVLERAVKLAIASGRSLDDTRVALDDVLVDFVAEQRERRLAGDTR